MTRRRKSPCGKTPSAVPALSPSSSPRLPPPAISSPVAVPPCGSTPQLASAFLAAPLRYRLDPLGFFLLWVSPAAIRGRRAH